MDPAFKVLKEDFVSGLAGGNIAEINAVALVSLSSFALWAALQSRHEITNEAGLLSFVDDFGLNCLALLSAITIYSSHPWLLNVLLLVPAFVIYLRPCRPLDQARTAAVSKKQPFITVYRSSMMIITCLAILAVDFPIFPRRFAKVETWGTSLMDLGVGSFVFSSGLVSASTPTSRRGGSSTFAQKMSGSLRTAAPVLVLGLVRLVITKQIDYPEHVSEYGVHWNFFFTLGMLPPFVAAISPIADYRRPLLEVVGVSLAGIYEWLLSDSGGNVAPLKAYILTAPRDGLLSQNREGIFSFIGYLAIFLAGNGAGTYCRSRTLSRRDILIRLAGWSGFWILAYLVSMDYLDLQVSRRLANLPYMLWVCGFNTSFAAGYLIMECIFFDRRTPYAKCVPPILDAVNENGLAVFLLANLLTGLINLSINSLSLPNMLAFFFLVMYSLALCTVAMFLASRKIVLKI